MITHDSKDKPTRKIEYAAREHPYTSYMLHVDPVMSSLYYQLTDDELSKIDNEMAVNNIVW